MRLHSLQEGAVLRRSAAGLRECWEERDELAAKRRRGRNAAARKRLNRRQCLRTACKRLYASEFVRVGVATLDGSRKCIGGHREPGGHVACFNGSAFCEFGLDR